MSTALAVAPVASHPSPTPVQSFTTFAAKHIAAVRRDVREAINRHDSRFVLLVTPENVAIRQGDSSCVRLDITGPGCQRVKWLRELYRIVVDEEDESAGLEVDFTCRDVADVRYPDGTKQTVPMLEVRFKFSVRKRKIRGQN